MKTSIHHSHSALPAVALGILLCTATAAFASVSYTVTDLGLVDGYALNNNNQVAGVSVGTDGLERPFLYSNGALLDLGTFGGPEGGALGLNNSGQVVGWADTTNGNQHAFFYSAGLMLDLGTLGGSNSYAAAISDNGYIAGWSDTTSGVAHAFLYVGGAMTDLGPGYAVAVNTNGQVVGWTVVSSSAWHAFLYSGGTLNNLGTLGGALSEGLDLNNSGQVVGWADTTNGTQHAFLYSAGTMIDLGAFSGTNTVNSKATGINTSAQAVGSFETNDLGGLHAFIYQGGTTTDLNSLIDPGAGWILSDAAGINDRGSILVSAIRPADLYHTLILTPSVSNSSLLHIDLVSNSVVLSWPTNATGLSLYGNTNVASPNWTLVTNTPVVVSGQNEVIFSPVPRDTQFFRLQSP